MNKNYAHLGLNYYYDSSNENFYYKNSPIKLSIKEKLLLKKLFDANRDIVSFIELEYFIWPDNSVSESSLRTLIYRLRNKLDYQLIETIPSFGVKLVSL
ncbi:winged helix-turn-helix domain-containing protein [Sulfurimonas sp. CS5]|uniref:winged helix-turn-helix domain-containing protein n=1 Tax=Sulfurimonas sp. CS5 TaxID=3391145 RepID=UPI0039EB80C0